MDDQPLHLTFHGVRGSTTTPGAGTLRYGGHTTCLDLALAPAHRLVLDCGSGLRRLQAVLPKDPGPGGWRFEVFFSHYHTDHVEGLPFFQPLYETRSRFVFHGFPWADIDVQQALEGSMTPPWFPIRIQDTGSIKEYVNLNGGPLWIEDVKVIPARVNHPQGAAGYRLERGGRAIVFITDNEPGDTRAEVAVRDLVRGADVLIHDAQYTPEEYDEQYRNWGHSSWKYAVGLARDAGADRLILFHHDPLRSDDELDRMVEQVRREFPDVDAAREGMTLEL
jgi:phosphoribosyl 1,2-cyclic phosphodiesterase